MNAATARLPMMAVRPLPLWVLMRVLPRVFLRAFLRAFLRPFLRASLLVWAAWLLAGCGTPPPTRWHSLLSTLPVTPAVNPQAAVPMIVIDLAPVAVPAAVDQPQWLVRTPDDSLRLLEQERWASSPRDELRQALAERLAQGFAAVDVRALTPAQTSGTLWRVRVEVQRFESIPGREAWLDSQWSITASPGVGGGAGAVTGAAARTGAALACRSSLRESAPGDVPALAEAHRRAVARLAAQIGTRLTLLARGQPAACGAADGA